MIPTFGELFGEPLPAYFTLLMLGFAAATAQAARWAHRAGLDHEVIIDLGLISIIAGVLGGRLLHVIADGYFMDYVHLCTDPKLVIWKVVGSAAECSQLEGAWDNATGTCHAQHRDCLAWAKFWNGGLAYYGGLISATVTGIWFLKRERFPVGHGIDAVGAALPLGIFFGRLGCFFGGCCFGIETHGPMGMVFPPHSPASEQQFKSGLLSSTAMPSLPVHPTQLYEAAGCLAMAAFLTFYAHPRKRFHGQILILFLALYAVLRFVIEFFRNDDRGSLIGLSTSQFIGVLILLALAPLYLRLSKNAASH